MDTKHVHGILRRRCAIRALFLTYLSLPCCGTRSFRINQEALSIGNFLIAERGGKLLGIMGLRDQSGFQRLKVHGYPPVVSAMRPFWNAASEIIGGVPLPRTGSVLPLRKATAIACENDDPVMLPAMLANALAGNDHRLLLLGMSAVDPLADGLRGMKARKQYGRHYLV